MRQFLVLLTLGIFASVAGFILLIATFHGEPQNIVVFALGFLVGFALLAAVGPVVPLAPSHTAANQV